MNNHENTLDDRPTLSQGEANQGATVRRKKPYEKPAFLYQAPLEAMANVCFPHPPGKARTLCSTVFS